MASELPLLSGDLLFGIVGEFVGRPEGELDGFIEGRPDGEELWADVGIVVGELDGLCVGEFVGQNKTEDEEGSNAGGVAVFVGVSDGIFYIVTVGVALWFAGKR